MCVKQVQSSSNLYINQLWANPLLKTNLCLFDANFFLSRFTFFLVKNSTCSNLDCVKNKINFAFLGVKIPCSNSLFESGGTTVVETGIGEMTGVCLCRSRGRRHGRSLCLLPPAEAQSVLVPSPAWVRRYKLYCTNWLHSGKAAPFNPDTLQILCMQFAACRLQPAACSMQHAAGCKLHAACCRQYAACSMQPTDCHLVTLCGQMVSWTVWPAAAGCAAVHKPPGQEVENLVTLQWHLCCNTISAAMTDSPY